MDPTQPVDASGSENLPRSLYIGDLNPNITESTLYSIFSANNVKIQSIRVCRDQNTRVSLGYAYINFDQHQDAKNAVENLNYTPIEGKPCRVMWSQRDPALRKSNKGNVFFKNLKKHITDIDLADLCSSFGSILSCKIGRDRETGESRGYGFVHFADENVAAKVIQDLNGKILEGQKIYVGPFKSKTQRVEELESSEFTNLYFKHLDASVTDEDITKVFAKYGKINSIRIPRDDQGVLKGYGFVDYSATAQAKAALEDLNGNTKTPICTSNEAGLYVSRFQKRGIRNAILASKKKKSAHPPKCNIFIKNIDDSVTEEILVKEFSPFGDIVSCRVARDPSTKLHKGFAYISFSSVEEAQTAITKMDRQMLQGKPIRVSLHMSAEERQRAKQMRQQQLASAQFNPRMPPGRNTMMGMQSPAGFPQGATPYPVWNPNNARNFPPNRGVPPPHFTPGNPSQQPPQKNFQARITPKMLAEMSPEDRKQLLGRILMQFTLQVAPPAQAPLIVGYLLKSDDSEIVGLLSNPNELKTKISEAQAAISK